VHAPNLERRRPRATRSLATTFHDFELETIAMKHRFTAALILAAFALSLACTSRDSDSGRANDSSAHAPNAATIWYCPMHPSYRSDHPGDCPICNMKLVPLRDDAAPGGTELVAGRATVTITPVRQQLIGVKTSPVARERVKRTIRAAGRVEADEEMLASISLKFGGWIDALYLKSVGQHVEKGDPILSIWSPDLFEAQTSYLIARASQFSDGGADIARAKLRAWDMTDAQIEELEKRGTAERTTTIVSKVRGVVTRRDAVAGSYAEPAKPLFEIADLSTVWVQAEIYESEIALVKPGETAAIEVASQPGELLHGTVQYVYPTLSETTRTLRARIAADNASGKLAPGMYAAVSIDVDLGEQLVIDDDAVLDSGTRQIAFVERSPGSFEPRKIVVGHRGDGRAIVLEGLAAGETVVKSAAFLVDSESRLRSALLQHESSDRPRE
jgi:multidrug efflux pump subunit AcrA (membrane-fusion protein)